MQVFHSVDLNCFLLEDQNAWEGADIPVLIQLFHSVMAEFNQTVGVCPQRKLVIQPDCGWGHPKCCRDTNNHYTIYLSARQNYWSQYVYQFAHEYCHYLIDGPMDGELETTFWFEELICELASMYFLEKVAKRWRYWNLSSIDGSDLYPDHLALLKLKAFAPSNLSYLDNLLHKNEPIAVPLSEWISKNIPILSQPEYHRDLYNQIASVLYGLFTDYPDLWKMIPYIYRPSKEEYKGFHSFIADELPNRIDIDIEHYPQFVACLIG